VRIAEAAEAQWQEFDLKAKLWTVPSERFKSEQGHPIPLSPAAVNLIKSLPEGNDAGYVFTTTKGAKPIGDFSATKARLDELMRADIGDLASFVTHDVRRTVRTRMSEMHIDDKIAEMVIGHGKRGLARVYDQARHMPAMRDALEAWAARLGGIVGEGATVMPMRKGRPA
jgi:integrase